MRGKYHMMDWEMIKWKLVLQQIIAQLVQNKLHQEDLTNYDVCPSNLIDALREMGWEDDEQEANGWQHDTWIYLSHPDYNFCLVLYYCGYTFEIKIYRSDIDD